MSIVIINPNSTSTMTDAMTAVAQKAAPQLTFEGWTSHKAPASIQGPEDGRAAAPHLLELVEQASGQGAEGIMIGCFDDTCLVSAAQLANCPVIGLGQASYYYAAMKNWRFSVITTLAVSVPVLKDNIAALGLDHHLAQVRASNIPVLDLETDPVGSAKQVVEEAMRAATDDNIAAIILGCAGMVQVVDQVRTSVPKHIIDPVACAAQCFYWLKRD